MLSVKTMGSKFIFIAIITFFSFLFAGQETEAQGKPVLSYGSEDGFVYDLQYRLHELGYYKASQDGKFGPLTRKSVVQFQKDYGLRADGIVGSQTWHVLYRNSFSKSEIRLMTRLVYAEARGEPYKGQVAVIDVLLNRIASDQFPNSVHGVIFQPLAFESVANRTIWEEPNDEARQAVLDAIRGWSPAYDSLYFFNPVTSTSKWIWSRQIITRIGNHVFAI